MKLHYEKRKKFMQVRTIKQHLKALMHITSRNLRWAQQDPARGGHRLGPRSCRPALVTSRERRWRPHHWIRHRVQGESDFHSPNDSFLFHFVLIYHAFFISAFITHLFILYSLYSSFHSHNTCDPLFSLLVF